MSVYMLLGLIFVSLIETESAVIETEPLVYVKSFVDEATPVQIQTWLKLKNLEPTQVSKVQKAIKDMVQTRALLKVSEDSVSVLNLPQGTQLNTTFSIPYPNILTIMSTSVNFLLDGFETEVVDKKLKDVQFTDGVVIPKNLHHDTLIGLFNRLPQYNLNQIGLVNEMNVQARAAFLAVRDILGRNLKDGWYDSFLSMSLDNALLTNRHDIEAPLNDLGAFAQSVLYEMKSLENVPLDKVPSITRGNGYAFGWWLNCEKGKSCLINVLPRDAIVSFSPALRIYVIPSIQLGFVIANTLQKGHNSRTMRDLLNFDAELFSRMLQSVKNIESETSESDTRPNDSNQLKEEDNVHHTSKKSREDHDPFYLQAFRIGKYFVMWYLDFVSRQYLIIRALLWVLFLLVAHLVTAWIYHGIWFVMCRLVKRTHDPRPKKE